MIHPPAIILTRLTTPLVLSSRLFGFVYLHFICFLCNGSSGSQNNMGHHEMSSKNIKLLAATFSLLVTRTQRGYYYFFIYNLGCSDQFTRTTTNSWIHLTPCKPSSQIRHRGGDKYAHKSSNLDAEAGNSLSGPLDHNLIACIVWLFYLNK